MSDHKANQLFPRFKYAICAVLLFLVACSGQATQVQTQSVPTSVSGPASNTKVPVVVATAVSTQADTPTVAPSVAPTALPAAADPTVDVCSYLTQDEVQPVLESPVSGVRKNVSTFNVTVQPNGNCTFMTSYGGLALVIAHPNDAQGSSAWTQDQTSFFTNVSPDSTTTQISGLGDTAVWMDNGKSAGGFGIAKYPYLVALVIGGKLPNNPAAYQPELKQLAQTVLDELPH